MNKKRLIELDIARGLAVIFMILIHVIIMFSLDSNPQMHPIYFESIEFLGGVPAAPVFMFLLGFGLVYSRNTDYKVTLSRGFKLIFVGYLLNILRSTIPGIIIYMQGMSNQTNLIDVIYTTLFSVDIFHFSGLALIFFSIIQKYQVKLNSIIMMLFGFIYLNQIMPHYAFDPAVSAFTSLFIGGDMQISYFPFLTWIAFPLAGYIYASYFKVNDNHQRWYLISFITTFIMLLIYSYLVYEYGASTGYENDAAYYAHNGIINIVYIIFIVWWISIMYYLSLFISPWFKNIFIYLSVNVSVLFFVHWVVIGILTIFIIPASVAFIPLLILTVIITIMSVMITNLYNNYKKKNKTI